jgi:hypothetical protein
MTRLKTMLRQVNRNATFVSSMQKIAQLLSEQVELMLWRFRSAPTTRASASMKITNRCFNPPCSFATNWLHHGARAIRSLRGERRGSFIERGNRHNAAETQELLAAVHCRLLSL